MASERQLIAASLRSRKAHDTLTKYIDRSTLSEPTKQVLKSVDAYYGRDAGADSIDVETLKGLIAQGVKNPGHRETLDRVLDGAAASEASAPNVTALALGAKRDAAGDALATAIAAGEGPEKLAELSETFTSLLRGGLQESVSSIELFRAPTLADFGQSSGGERIKVYPKALNERLAGGAEPGNHIIVFARPEVGKTAFGVNATAGFLTQGLRTHYAGNEEPVRATARRIMSRLTGVPALEVEAREEELREELERKGYGNLTMQSMAPGSIDELRRAIEEVEPQVLVVDQLRNIKTGNDNFVQRLEEAAAGVRSLLIEYGMVGVSITQAGDSAANKSILEMGDVDSSNTGIPGQCDVLLGVGMSKEDEAAGRRILTLCKNKIGGGHDYFPTRFDPQLSRYTSME